jgi:hypothetical protein
MGLEVGVDVNTNYILSIAREEMMILPINI